MIILVIPYINSTADVSKLRNNIPPKVAQYFVRTSRPTVTERSRDATCLSVVSFNSTMY